MIRLVLAVTCAGALAAMIAAASTPSSEPAKLRSRATVRLPDEPLGLALDGRSLWVSIGSEHVLLRLDARTGRRLGRLVPIQKNPLAFGGGEIVVGRGAGWIATAVRSSGDPDLHGRIGPIDQRSGKFSIVTLKDDPPLSISVGPAGVWVSGGHTLRQIDPSTGRVLRTTEVRAPVDDVAVGRGAVWAASPRSGRVYRFDPRRRRIVRTIAVGQRRGGMSLVAGRYVWVLTDRGAVALDPRTNRIARRVALRNPNAIALDRTNVWIYAGDGVYSVDARGRASRRFRFATRAYGMLAVRGSTMWLSESTVPRLRRIGP